MRLAFDGNGIVGGNQVNLKSMSLSRLTDLRHRVEAALASKVIDQRRTIESELANSVGCRALKRYEKMAPGLG